MTIRLGKSSLSFTMHDAANTERPIIFEPYIVRGGISMTANLREAFKSVELLTPDIRRCQLLSIISLQHTVKKLSLTPFITPPLQNLIYTAICQ